MLLSSFLSACFLWLIQGLVRGHADAALSELAQVEPKYFPPFELTRIDFNLLLSQDDSEILQLTNALVTVGAVQIVNVPQFDTARRDALSGLAACLQTSPPDLIHAVTMNDGSLRRSVAATSRHGSDSALASEPCAKASSRLRAVTDGAARQLLVSLDVARRRRSAAAGPHGYLVEPYTHFEDLFSRGEHLEHLHSFYGPREDELEEQEGGGVKRLFGESAPWKGRDDSLSAAATMPLHTDAGLFIAMTAGLYVSAAEGPPVDADNGLYVQLATGAVARAVARDDAVLFLVGEGGSRWLSPVLGAPLRAVPHALLALPSMLQAKDGALTRSWYGKMFLPPSDALIPATAPGRRVPYSEYRRSEVESYLRSGQLESLPSACEPTAAAEGGGTGHRALRALALSSAELTNTLCDGGTGVMCWKNCYTGAELPYCGLEAECVDTATGEIVDGSQMCPSEAGMDACELACMGVISNETSDEYCYGSGTSMYMDGFTSVVTEKDGSTACLNLLFTDWTLDSETKYVVACVGVFFLAVLTEALTLIRSLVTKAAKHSALPSLVSLIGLSFLYGAQTMLGYMLMLAAMTYSVEIFACMIAGLTVGYALFNFSFKKPKAAGSCHDTAGDANPEEANEEVGGNSLLAGLISNKKKHST
jgi:hypothetical protein